MTINIIIIKMRVGGRLRTFSILEEEDEEDPEELMEEEDVCEQLRKQRSRSGKYF